MYNVKQADVETELKPHQQRVIDKLLASHGVLVAHGMGSGKTLSSIAAADKLGLPVDAITPASLVPNYQKELKKHVANQDTFPAMRLRSYEAATRGGGEIDPNRLAIADEAHRMRNQGTGLHRLARQMSGAKARLLLTGTPIYNQPEDLATLLNTVRGDQALPEDPSKFRAQFVGSRKVNAPFLQRIMGAKPAEVPQLKNREKLVDLATGYVDTHAAGGPDFPSRTDEDIEVPMSKKQHEIYKYHEGALPWYLRMKVRANLPLNKSEAAELNAFGGGLRQVSNTPRPYVENMTDEEENENAPKLQRAIEELVKHQQADKNFKGLVYSNYLDAGLNPYARMLAKHNIPAGVFHGGLAAGEKKALIDQYNKGLLKALLVSSSGSEGLDLKGTKMVQLLEPHFNSAKLNQVLSRAIRYKSHADLPENERNVKVQRYFATQPKGLFGNAPTGIDRYLYSRAGEKDELTSQIMDALNEASKRGPLKTSDFHGMTDHDYRDPEKCEHDKYTCEECCMHGCTGCSECEGKEAALKLFGVKEAGAMQEMQAIRKNMGQNFIKGLGAGHIMPDMPQHLQSALHAAGAKPASALQGMLRPITAAPGAATMPNRPISGVRPKPVQPALPGHQQIMGSEFMAPDDAPAALRSALVNSHTINTMANARQSVAPQLAATQARYKMGALSPETLATLMGGGLGALYSGSHEASHEDSSPLSIALHTLLGGTGAAALGHHAAKRGRNHGFTRGYLRGAGPFLYP